MTKRRGILDQLMMAADLPAEHGFFTPLVEIAGDGRVIIENHKGIIRYCRECICIKVDYGSVSVCGSGLALARMTREQLVIVGCIASVELCKRGNK